MQSNANSVPNRFNQRRIEKIAALAERGVDGEKRNAAAILARLLRSPLVQTHRSTITNHDIWQMSRLPWHPLQ